MKTVSTKTSAISVFFKTLCVLLVLMIVQSANAQSNAGKDFWAAQPPMFRNPQFNISYDTARFAILLANPGEVPANVTITNPVKPTQNVVVVPGELKVVFFESENAFTQGTGTFSNNVYHITSDMNIVAYTFCPYYNISNNDAAILFPTNSLGRKYMPGSYANNVNVQQSFFGVIATQPGTTTVSVYDRAGTFVNAVSLQQGQYYQRFNGRTVATDVTGWYIQADKPVAALGGNQLTSIGNSNVAGDNLFEHLTPIETLSSNYVASPTNTRPIGCTTCVPDVFRYVAVENGTVVKTSIPLQGRFFPYPVAGSVTPVDVTVDNVNGITLDKGQFVELATNQPHIITANNPFLAYQYFISELASSVAGQPLTSLVGGTGDPSMWSMPVVEQFQYHYDFIVNESFLYNFVNITAPEGANITLDSLPITLNWTPAGTLNGVPYQSASYPVTGGTHKLHSDTKMGIIVSGFEFRSSYAYMGGSGLEPINAGCVTNGPYQQLICVNQPTSFQLNGTAKCSDGSDPISVTWTGSAGVTFNNPNIEDPIATVPGFGTYTVTMSVNCGGNIVSCTTELLVREALTGCAGLPPISLIPPPDKLVPTDPGVNYATSVNIGVATYDAPQPAVLVNDSLTHWPVGPTTVTWTVTDKYGRTRSGTHVITVAPPPTIVPPPIIVVPTDAGQNYATVSSLHGPDYWNSPSTYWVYDDYSTPVSSNIPSNNQYTIGDHVITWSVVDQWGRTASGTQVVRVVPPPSIVPPPMIIVPTDAAQNYATVNPLHGSGYWQYGEGSGSTYWVFENNSAPTASGVPAGNKYISNSATNHTDYTITWTTGADQWGRSASGTQIVRVVPPPRIIAPPTITATVSSPTATANIPNLAAATYWNYGGTYWVYNNASTPTNNGIVNYPVGTTNVTWTTGTDMFGRSATGVQQVIVNYVSGEVLGNQGCTPGFWKNWPQAWGCGYSFSSKFFTVFAGVTNYQKLSANLTMGDAVDMNGGKYNALVRHAVAALLSACHNGVAYPYTSAQIKAATVAMFNTGKATLGNKTYTDVEKLKDEFARANELGCPLGMNNAVPTSRAANPSLEVVKLDANIYPNPSTGYFTIQVNSGDRTTNVSVRIMDAFGRAVQVLNNVPLEKAITFGEKLASGAYYAEVIQGEQRKMIQLVKAK